MNRIKFVDKDEIPYVPTCHSPSAETDADYTFPTPPESGSPACNTACGHLHNQIETLRNRVQELELDSDKSRKDDEEAPRDLDDEKQVQEKAAKEETVRNENPRQKDVLELIKTDDLPVEFFVELAKRDDLFETLLRTVSQRLMEHFNLEALISHLQAHRRILETTNFAPVANFL